MPKNIASIFKPSGRFMRSVHLERDFRDSHALNGYILTEHSRESLTRIAEGLRKDSSQRAWRITGNYGAGKSSFALLLAHWLSGDTGNMPDMTKSQLSYRKLVSRTPHLIPILVTGSRVSMAEAIHRSLVQTLKYLYVGRRKPRAINEVIEGSNVRNFKVSEEHLIDLLGKINSRIIADKLGTGLLLIIDELGKFLEFAALHPEQQDVYLLQSLAETASRSGEEPIIVIGLLHQGFQAYAHNLSEVTQREWEKVAARYEQILFDQPLEQLATLISSALNLVPTLLPKGTKKDAKDGMKKALELGWFGPIQANSILLENAEKIYPLHSTVLPILTRVFKRFGQNERSLFSFLLSNEPFSLQSFSERPLKIGEFYRLCDLYDYVRINFGHRLSIQSYRSHWNQIDSMIQSYITDNSIELMILKTIGILNLLDMNDLIPNEEAILLALEGMSSSQKKIKTILRKLHSDKKILHYRGAAGGYCLWPYTSVNLELAYEKAADSIQTAVNISQKISKYIEPTPIVARRHYIKTGNLRHFEALYLPLSKILQLFDNPGSNADGMIIVPLCETEEERRKALRLAKDKKAKESQEIIMAISPPLNNLSGLLTEVERWDWVSRNTPELANDKFAVEEVSRQGKAALGAFNKRLQEFIGLDRFHGETSLECYHRGKKLPVRTGRDLLQKLSFICDEMYSDAPCIKNELINRRSLSSAAAGARMRLIERMLSNSTAERLGMEAGKRPPEMSMYLSVLKASNIHSQDGESWRISKPLPKADPCHIIPSWECIESILKRKLGNKVSVSEISNTLRNSPYGVRDGLIPLLLAAFVVDNLENIALYENGTFVPSIESEEFLRLTKAPDSFELQFCSIKGVRSDLLQKLHAVITGEKDEARKPAIIELVKPLCVFVAGLPEYTRSTKNISSLSIAVRESILSTRDPFSLVFEELPIACGEKSLMKTKNNKSSMHSDNYIRKLKRALSELRMAYPQLLERIQESISIAFETPLEIDRLRKEIPVRAGIILTKVTEPRLKAFCLRLKDSSLSDSDWIESVGSFLASRPPSKWHERDEETFTHELALLVSRFQRIEGMVFKGSDTQSTSKGMRVVLTRNDGQECDRVIYLEDHDEKKVNVLQKQIDKLIAEHKHLGVIATSRVLWEKLSDSKEKS